MPKFSNKSIAFTGLRTINNLYVIPKRPIYAHVASSINQHDDIASTFKMLQTHYSIANQNQYQANTFWLKTFLGAPLSVLYKAAKDFEDFKFPNLTAQGMLKNWQFLSETSTGHKKAIPSNRNRTSPKVKITVKLEGLQKLTNKNKVYADRIGGKFPITSYDGFN